MTQKITPFLWFDTEAEEAATFYTGLFPDGRIVRLTRFGEGGPGPAGQVMTVEFELAGQRFVALNGGPVFEFSEAVSFSIDCASQEEIDHLWERLTADGGTPGQCGWLKDRFGLSWQIVPRVLGEMLGSPERDRARRAMQAMLPMKKIDIAALQAAFDG